MSENKNTGKTPLVDPSEDTTTKLFKAKEYFKSFFLDVIDLEHGVDKRSVINEIKSNNNMSGANAWMLMCSIVIASIGLDLDSQAVIIGAMLISPLMSPILGIGLSVGINDMNTLKKSLAHFTIAIAIALLTSTIYFYLSPFDQITPQIQARTEPTILDVLIAFFGGIAGIISNARKDVSTTLPGVAIATALMPPLCVTGFGIANAENWEVALSSFYLFFVNTFFVALATFIIVKFLDFPSYKHIDKKSSRRNLIYMALFSLIVSIPSFFIFGKVLKRVRTDIKIQNFIDEGIGDDKVYLDDYQYVVNDTTKAILLKVYGNKINQSRSAEFEDMLRELGLKDTKVQIIPTSEINLDRINKLESEINGVQHLASQLNVVQEEKLENDKLIEVLKSEISSFRLDSIEFGNLCSELKAIQPDISSINYAQGQRFDFEKYSDKVPIIIVEWKGPIRKSKTNQINAFLKAKFRDIDIKVLHI